MADIDLESLEQHSDDDDCPPFADPHMDTGGCDHRYHCCEHHGDCAYVDWQDGCVLLGMRKDEADQYAKELEERAD